MKKAFTFIATACLLATSAGAQDLTALQFKPAEIIKNGPAKLAPAKTAASDIIFEADGEAKIYNKTFDVNYMGFVMEAQSSSTTIVFGADNTVYFADPISLLPSGTYIKGTMDGNKITVAYPQCFYESEEEGAYNYTLLEPTEDIDPETDMPIAIIHEPGTITYTVSENGTITLDPLPENCALGIVVDGSMYLGICEFNITFTPDNREIVTPPADLETP